MAPFTSSPTHANIFTRGVPNNEMAHRTQTATHAGPSELAIKGCGDKRPMTEYSSTYDPVPTPRKRPRLADNSHSYPIPTLFASATTKIEPGLMTEDDYTQPSPLHAPQEPEVDDDGYYYGAASNNTDSNPDMSPVQCAHCHKLDHTLAVCHNVTTPYLKGCPWCNVRSHNFDDCPYRSSMTDANLIELLIHNRANAVMIYTTFDWLRLFRRYSDDRGIWERGRGFPHTLGFAKQTIARGKHYLDRGNFIYGKQVKGDPLTMDVRTIVKTLKNRPELFRGQTAIPPTQPAADRNMSMRTHSPTKPPAAGPLANSGGKSLGRCATNSTATRDTPRKRDTSRIRMAPHAGLTIAVDVAREVAPEMHEENGSSPNVTMTDAGSQTVSDSGKDEKVDWKARAKALETQLKEERNKTQELSNTLQNEKKRHEDSLEASRRRIDGLVDKLLG